MNDMCEWNAALVIHVWPRLQACLSRWVCMMPLAVPWLRRLVAGLTADVGSAEVECVVDEVALGQVFL
jgi:hypothetical protein